jgi:hypothetical protein
MKRKLEAKVKADVKVYLIPKDQLQYDENGKPKLKKNGLFLRVRKRWLKWFRSWFYVMR